MPSSAADGTSGFLKNAPLDRKVDVLRAGVQALRDRLPASWSLREQLQPADPPGSDAVLRLRASTGEELVVLVEAKRLINTRDVPVVLEALQRAASAYPADDPVLPLLVARYLPPATRERIAAAGAGYVDATGNLLLTSDLPALFLRDRGADRDPWRGPGRPRGSLQGPPAARVVRALIDLAPSYTVPDLAKRAGTSTGTTYRVVDFLDQEGLLERRRRGPISEVRWRALLERWSQDYGFARSSTVRTLLEPRGLTALTERLAKLSEPDYVVTGSLAAERIAAYAPARLAMLYVRDIPQAVDVLGLRPVESGANVALAASDYDVVFERAELSDGVRFAAPSQVAVDLLTGPGRNPSEAIALLDWMERNEAEWRC